MKSNIEWKKWGEIDPLFGVATWKGKEKEGTDPWDYEDFYEMGKMDWIDFQTRWEKFGIITKNCLEIGCGAGRITKHLAQYFNKVKAIDVSEGMLEFAKGKILTENVEFIHTNGDDIPLPSDSINAVFSTDVFQHFDNVDIAANYFREIFRVLQSKSSSIMVHLPVYQWPENLLPYRLLHKLKLMNDESKADRKRKLIQKGKWSPFMRGLRYETKWVFWQLENIGFHDIELQIFRIRKDGTMYSFVLARK